MSKTPKIRDINLKPLKGTNLQKVDFVKSPPQITEEKKITDSKFLTCSRCMGFGGMDGSCPKCGGTGFSQ